MLVVGLWFQHSFYVTTRYWTSASDINMTKSYFSSLGEGDICAKKNLAKHLKGCAWSTHGVFKFIKILAFLVLGQSGKTSWEKLHLT